MALFYHQCYVIENFISILNHLAHVEHIKSYFILQNMLCLSVHNFYIRRVNNACLERRQVFIFLDCRSYQVCLLGYHE